MKIITCFKVVPDEQDIELKDNGELSFERAKLTISNYDLNSIEAGAQLAEKGSHELIGVSVGGAKINESKLKKNALSRGLTSLFMLADEKLSNLDTHQTAKLLKIMVEKIADWDLVLCGEGSSDLYAQQVGVQLGELLGATVINSVSKITEENGKIIVERTLENETEVIEVELPAVLSVTSFINLPRIPGMKNILSAGKKPSTVWYLTDIGGTCPSETVEVIETKAPRQMDRKKDITEDDSAESIQVFIEKIAAELR